MSLAHDDTRCEGRGLYGACPKAEACARYAELDRRGEKTPVVRWLCSDDYDQFVAVEVAK